MMAELNRTQPKATDSGGERFIDFGTASDAPPPSHLHFVPSHSPSIDAQPPRTDPPHMKHTTQRPPQAIHPPTRSMAGRDKVASQLESYAASRAGPDGCVSQSKQSNAAAAVHLLGGWCGSSCGM